MPFNGLLVFVLLLLSHSLFVQTRIVSRAQLTFPPTNGPCRQNVGLTPLECTDRACIDVPKSGICNIQTQEGFPICGCCDLSVTLSCNACGGDAGGGICEGTGASGIAYQGCSCSVDGGNVPNGDEHLVCPEDQGLDTQLCDASACGGDTFQFIPTLAERFLRIFRGNVPIPVFPFPIPPPGFPPPPPGTQNPKGRCPEYEETKCSECQGSSGWCQSGETVGCPCQDDECPSGDSTPTCSDAACGGSVNSDIISSCKGGDESENKGCACQQLTEDSPPYTPFSTLELAEQRIYLALLGISSSPTSTTTSPVPEATGTLTCSGNTVDAVPASMVETDGDVTPNQLLYTLREVLCNNQCGEPVGIPSGVAWTTGSKTPGDCEISIAVSTGIEAYMYRQTASTGVQWQQCWDSTQNIIERCVKEGPNVGWVNGPAEYQFYQGGFRQLNDKSAIHAPMSGNALQSTTSAGVVSPSKLAGFTCGSGTGGTRLADCFGILGSIVKGQVLDPKDTTKSICTDDSTCLKSGKTISTDGKTVLSEYCEVAANSDCAFVIATKEKTFGGFPERSCVSPADMSNFIRLGVNECGAGEAQGVWAAGFQGDDEVTGVPYTVLAMVDLNNVGVVYVP
ncbi:hypothetical protein IFR05_011448 [Cadophora sp. M221]|nr:hypothetical protein IFR05_011448 [Cadophora sp. M221]